jgi:hypothetical protein
MAAFAGIAAWLILTASISYAMYLVGVIRTTAKWKTAYQRLYRLSLVELMKAHGLHQDQPKRAPAQPKAPVSNSDSNLLQFDAKKGSKDETRH